jgi:hypothetical protein
LSDATAPQWAPFVSDPVLAEHRTGQLDSLTDGDAAVLASELDDLNRKSGHGGQNDLLTLDLLLQSAPIATLTYAQLGEVLIGGSGGQVRNRTIDTRTLGSATEVRPVAP